MSKLLPIMLFLLLFCGTASATTYTVGASGCDYTTIQAAVNAASSYDTIYVYNGSYTENVDISTAHLTLQGEGRDVVTVTAANSGDHVFEVTADYVNISGFTATGTTVGWKAGIYLISSDHCNVFDNNASNNDHGIYMRYSNNAVLTNNDALNSNRGIHLYYSSSNTLTSNTASNKWYGICMDGSSDNTLTNNTANSNNWCGIRMYSSSNNTLTSNNALDNPRGIYVQNSNYNMFTSNTANLNTLYGIHMWSSSNNIFDHCNSNNNTNYDYFAWASSLNNTLLDCDLDNATSMMNDSTSEWIIKYTTSKVTSYSDTTLNQTISPTDVTTHILPTVDDYTLTISTLDDFTATTDVSTAILQLVEFNPGGYSHFKVSSDTPTIVTTFNMGGFAAGEVVRLKKTGLGVTCGRANALGVATFVYADGYSDHDFETDPVSLYVGLVGANHSFTTDSYNATAFTSQINITRSGTGSCAVSIEMPLITNTSYTKLSYTVTNVTNGFKVTDNGYAVINFTTTDNAIVVITPCESGKTSNLPLVVGGAGAAVITVIIFLRRRRR